MYDRRWSEQLARRSGSQPMRESHPGYGLASDGELLLDKLHVLYKRRWSATTVFLLVVATVSVVTFTATPIYEARLRLLVDAERPNVVTFQGVIEPGPPSADYRQTQYDLLRSRSLARRTMEGLNLWSRPEFGGSQDNGSARRTNQAGSVVPPSRPKAQEPRPSLNEKAARSRAVDAFLRRLNVAPLSNSRIAEVTFRSVDPAVAMRVVNSLAHAYIEQNLEFKLLSSRDASKWLVERLAEQRAQVEASEAALQQYRAHNDAVSLDERQDIVVQKLGDLNAALTHATLDAIAMEALYHELRSIQADQAALDTFPPIQANSYVQQLKTNVAALQRQYAELSQRRGGRHPEIVRLGAAIELAEQEVATEIEKLVDTFRAEYRVTQTKEHRLAEELNAQKREALTLDRTAIEYDMLRREAASNRQVFESLLQRAKETGVSAELLTSNLRIVDEAEMPLAPIWPRTRRNLWLAILGGFALGVGVAFFFEYVDDRIKSPEDVTRYLDVPFLGLLPLLHPDAGNPSPESRPRTPLIAHQGPAPVPRQLLEAFRSLRTNVVFSETENRLRSVLITSAGVGEGKTMVACNLAIALAQSGSRVLLVDADMRRPRVHEIFAVAQEPGLSNLIVNQAQVDSVVLESSIANLWLLPAGQHPPNPPELLGSERFKALVERLGSCFEWVIIDSPPVQAVTDATVLATTASGVLFVVGAEMAGRSQAKAAIEQLQVVRAKMVGAVLNRVDLKRHGYYYRKYYRRAYAEYYAA